ALAVGVTSVWPKKRMASWMERREPTRPAEVMGPREKASSVEAVVTASTPKEPHMATCSEVVVADCSFSSVWVMKPIGSPGQVGKSGGDCSARIFAKLKSRE